MASSADTSVSFNPLELLVERGNSCSRLGPRSQKMHFPLDPRRKGEILIIKGEEKASLERLTPFWINIRTKALNSEPAVT